MDMDNPTVLILQIEQLWRQRQDWLRAYNRLLLQAGAICRRYEAGDKRAAAALLKKLVKGTVEHPAAMAVAPLLIAMEQLEPHLQRAEQGAITLARKLPIATWCKTVRGVGVDGVALASIVGEAGDVTRFRTVSCFWKRMGLAVIGGERQRRCKEVEKALEHGFNPRRRAQMWVMSDSLFKGQRKTGPYREVYDKRRAHTAAAHPDWTKAHSHNDAVRIMSKQFLCDFYVAWMQAAPFELKPLKGMPPALLPGPGGQNHSETQLNRASSGRGPA